MPTNGYSDETLIVIPTLNEEASIEKCITSILQGTHTFVPIIVADGGSTDRTKEIVEKMSEEYSQICLVDNPRRTQACAINIAARMAGPGFKWLVRADAHAEYEMGYVDTLIREIRQRRCGSVVVSMNARGYDYFQRAVAYAQNSLLGNGGSLHRKCNREAGRYVDHGHHAIFDLRCFLEAGGYDEEFTHNEDFELDFRLLKRGVTIWLTHSTHVTYLPRSTPLSLATQYYRHGRGRGKTIVKHRITPKLRQLIPVLALMCYVSAIVLAPVSAVFTMPALAHLTICLLWGACLALAARDTSAILSGFAAVTMHLCWAVGLLCGLFVYTRRSLRSIVRSSGNAAIASRIDYETLDRSVLD